ncbi:MAG TPA: hypothetical protein VMH05_23740 [Bryobacteraceae bacterium]|nr:hypothetical protein [Bryobacteraceae bacterium]
MGESQFEDRQLTDMVQEGAISTGNFAAFLAMIFRSDDASFTYDGDSSGHGRTLAEFSFQVSYSKSHYRFGTQGDTRATAYSGTFLVDANTGELLRLVVRTSLLPAETGACYADTTMDYALVRLDDLGALLLPTDSRLQIDNVDGSESVNHTVFSACHRFLGESTISFDSPPDGGAPVPHRPSRTIAIPQGLSFRIALTQAMDTATAAAGDPITAKLTTPIRDRSKVLVPAGAAVAARIVRMRQFYGLNPSVAINIKLETVEVAGQFVPLSAIPDIEGHFQKPTKGTLQRPLQLGTLSSLEDRSAAFVFPEVSLPYLIRSGLESRWVTANPADDSPATAK